MEKTLSRKEAIEQGFEYACSENGKRMKKIKDMDIVDVMLKPYILQNQKIVKGNISGQISDELMLNID